jgi:hypothetical protein
MVAGYIGCRVGIVLTVLLPLGCLAGSARADTAAANTCAGHLAPDAKAIYDKTLPQVTPGADLRGLLTANTRSLAMAGTIGRGDARASAQAAAKCLEMVNN